MSTTRNEGASSPEFSQVPRPFIILSSPVEAQAKHTRRTVRSHAARVSAPHSSKSSDATTPHKKTKNQSYLLQIRHDGLEDELSTEGRAPSSSSSGGDSSTRMSTPSLLTPLTGDSSFIPASESLVYTQPYIPLILNNYLEYLAVPIPEIDVSSQVPLLRTIWFSVVLHSPAIFHVIILFSASHYVVRNPHLGKILEPTILYLKQCALQSISSLVYSQTGCPSDEVIAAASKMASYEAIFGGRDAFERHMSAVANMVENRGGLAMLGLDGFLARLLLFIDTNSAHLLSTSLYLSKYMLPRREPFLAPNLARFVGAPLDGQTTKPYSLM